MSFSLMANQPWIAASAAQTSTTGPGDPALVTVELDRDRMPAEGGLRLGDNAGTVSVLVDGANPPAVQARVEIRARRTLLCDFQAQNTFSFTGDPVVFSDLSQAADGGGTGAVPLERTPGSPAAIVAWAWDFGDGASSTDQVTWDISIAGDEHVTVNTPRFQAIVGHLAGRTNVLDNLDVDGTDRAALALVSLDGNPLSTTTQALLVAAANQTAQGQALHLEDGWYTLEPGVPPMQLDAVPATLTFKGLAQPDHVRIYPLDGTGARGPAAPSRLLGDTIEFDLGVLPTPWYELAVE